MAGSCVICYKRDGRSSLSDGNGVCTNEKIKVFFKALQRHLNTETSNKALDSISGGSEDLTLFLLDHAVSSGMIACGSCLQIMNSFSVLYHELKMTELNLNGKLWSLKMLMESASNYVTEDWLRESGDKLNIDKNYWSSGEEMLEMLTDLKDSLIKKCSQKIELGLPKVAVPKLFSGVRTTKPEPVTPTDSEQETLEMANKKKNSKTKQEVVDTDYEESEENTHNFGNDNDAESLSGSKIDVSLLPLTTNTDIKVSAVCQDNDLSSSRGNGRNGELTLTSPDEGGGKPNGDSFIEDKVRTLDRPSQAIKKLGQKEKNKNVQTKEQSDFTLSRRSLRAVNQCLNCKRTFSTQLALSNHQASCEVDLGNLDSNNSAEEDDGDQFSESSESDSGEESVLNCNGNDISLSDGGYAEDDLDEKILTKTNSYVGSRTSVNKKTKSCDIVTKKSLRQKECLQKYILKCPDCTSLFLKLSELLVHRQQSHSREPQDANEDVALTTIRVEILVSPTTSPLPKSAGNEIKPHYTTIEVADEVFICPFDSCKLACYSKQLLDEHSSLHGEFKCHSCDVVKPFAPDLALHELTHESKIIKQKSNQKHCCRRCDFKCAQEMVYIRHFLKNHLSILSPHGGVECAICKIPNVRIGGMDENGIFRHYKKYHDTDGVRKIMCGVSNCPSYFTSGNQKWPHRKIYHGNPAKNTWKCFKCTKTFDSNSELIDHINAHEQYAKMGMEIPDETCKYRFKCSECSKLFRFVHELLLHRKKVHSTQDSTSLKQIKVDIVDDIDKDKILLRIEISDKVFICSKDNCKGRFYKMVDLEHHRKYFHGNFKCAFCETVKSSAVDLAKHEMEHASSGTFDCARCKTHFNVKEEFIFHHITTHTDMDVVNYNCPICSWSRTRSKRYTRSLHRDDLYKHLKLNHDIYNCNEESIKRCGLEECDAYFLRRTLLDSHKRNWHKLSGKDVFSCHLCHKRFKSRIILLNHRLKVHSEKLNFCHRCTRPNCGKSFEDKFSLHVHIRLFHRSTVSKLSNDFKRHNCGKVFAGRRRLDAHITTRTCNSGRRFVCTHCGKEFRKKSNLRRHKLAHAVAQNRKQCGNENDAKSSLHSDVDVSIPITGTDIKVTDQSHVLSNPEENMGSGETASSVLEESNNTIACLSEPMETEIQVNYNHIQNRNDESGGLTNGFGDATGMSMSKPSHGCKAKEEQGTKCFEKGTVEEACISRQTFQLRETEENKGIQPKEQCNLTIPRRSLRAVHQCLNCKRTFSTKLALTNHQESCEEDLGNLDRNSSAEEDDGDLFSESSESNSEEESVLDSNDNDTALSDGDYADSDLDKKILTKTNTYAGSRTSTNGESKSCEIVTNQSLRQKECMQKYILKCPDCTSLFLKLSELLVHRQQSHSSKAADANEAVTKTTIRVEILVSPTTSSYPKSVGNDALPHYSTIKVADEVFICPVDSCKLACYSKKLLNEHSSLHGEFKCHVCDVVESFAPDLALHELTHEPKIIKKKATQKYCCRRCDFKCARKMVYIRHFLKNHLLLFSPHGGVECAICKFPNVTIGGLDENGIFKHYKKFHDADDGRKMKCDVPDCPSYFLRKSQKRSHQKIYHDSPAKNTWKCFRCTKTFDSNSKLINHVNAHEQDAKIEMKIPDETNKYRFKCSECSELFRFVHELLLHREKVHSTLQPQDSRFRKIEVDAVDSNNKEKILFRIEISDKVFICSKDNCKGRFYKMVDLEHHRKYFHGNFKCAFCETVKSSAVDLAKHEIEHASTGTFDCARCKTHFNVKEEFIFHHITTHTDMDVVNYNCPICSWSRTRSKRYTRSLHRDDLYKHLKLNHDIYNCNEESIKRCDLEKCDAYFLRRSLLDSHKKNWHKLSGKDVFSCHLCHKRSNSRNNLLAHQERKHAKDLDFYHKCPHLNCRKSFEDKYSLQEHIRVSHESKFSKPSKDFRCQNCGKGFGEKYRLDYHIKVQACSTERRFVCPQCGKVFRKKEKLKIHELIHAGPQSWEHSCEICGKRAITKGSLKMHMGVHSSEKAFVCQVCGAKYAHRHNLRIHINNKHGDIMQDIPKKYDLTNYNRKVKKDGDEKSLATATLKDRPKKKPGRLRKAKRDEKMDSESNTTDSSIKE